MPVSVRTLARATTAAVVTLLGLHFAYLWTRYGLGHDHVFGLLRLIRLDREQNIPTWFASAGWLLAAGLFAGIARAKRLQDDRFARHWRGLAWIAGYLSADEFLSLHEQFTLVAARFIPPHGVLYWGWVVVGALAVLVVAAAYWSFLRALPPRFQRLFLGAAVVFVGGAIGVEMIGAAEAEVSGGESLRYGLLAALEEGMEMAGVALLLYTLAAYAAEYAPEIRVRFVASGDDPLHAARTDDAPVRAPAYSPLLAAGDRRTAAGSAPDDRG